MYIANEFLDTLWLYEQNIPPVVAVNGTYIHIGCIQLKYGALLFLNKVCLQLFCLFLNILTKYSDEDVHNALIACRTGMSQRGASRKFDIPQATLSSNTISIMPTTTIIMPDIATQDGHYVSTPLPSLRIADSASSSNVTVPLRPGDIMTTPIKPAVTKIISKMPTATVTMQGTQAIWAHKPSPV